MTTKEKKFGVLYVDKFLSASSALLGRVEALENVVLGWKYCSRLLSPVRVQSERRQSKVAELLFLPPSAPPLAIGGGPAQHAAAR